MRKMACMAGTIILKQQNTSSTTNNNLSNIGNKHKNSLRSNIKSVKKATNLSHSLSRTEANERCCLWLQQPKVVESNSNTHKVKPMQHNTTDSSSSKCSSSTTNDRTLTTYNNNNNHNNYQQSRPLTLSIAVLIMSLSILLMQMPTFAYGKPIYAESPLASLSLASAETDAAVESQPAQEQPSKLILSLLTDTQDEDITSSPSSDLAALDILTSLDVLRHIQRTREYQKERRMRVRKRHLGDYIITKYLHEDSHNLEWKNPCNVDHVQTNTETQRINKQQVYQYLKKFEHDLYMEYDFINATATKININDIADWSKHDEVYKFLPKLMANGSIALSRWYRNMQVYVASFGYLARTQYKFDKKKQIFADDISQELNKLLLSARFILCELETTINASANVKKIKTISRRAMNSRLNFVTKHQLAGMGNGAVIAANTVDLKFAKYSYFQYLKHMHKILNRKLQHKGKKYGYVDNNNEDTSVNAISVGDDTSSIDFSSIFKSDANLSLGESVELLLKATKKPQGGHKRRQHKKKNA